MELTPVGWEVGRSGLVRWQFKAKHMDAVVFFKMGKFYELFEMDAHVGVEHLGLQYMAGDQPHAGFPDKGYVLYYSH